MESEKQIVKNFSKQMVEKLDLRKDRYVPLAWKTLDFKRLIFLLYEEIAELQDAYNEDNLELAAGDAVDIANYGMFIRELIIKQKQNDTRKS